MNILIIGYYGFEDGYYAYGKYFKNYLKTVSFFPLIECRDLNKNNKTSITDIETIISGNELTKNIYSPKLINHNCPKNIVLIAHNNDMLSSLKIDNILVIEHINLLKKKFNFQLIQVNWDPIINSTNNNIIHFFDKSYCSDPSLLKLYKNVKFFKAGYSKDTSFYKEDTDYKCDVSFIGTNLYENSIYPNQTLNRKLIIDLLYSDKSIKLHIYGPKFLGERYPDSYKGFINYKDCYKVFSNSKINLNISPLVNVNTNDKLYYSERLPQILASNGVMLCNNDLSPMLIPNEHYLHVNNISELISSVHYFLNNTVFQDKIKKNVTEIKDKFNYQHIIKDICTELL
jgi:hypothetical protein